jgi:hypothetical protein
MSSQKNEIYSKHCKFDMNRLTMRHLISPLDDLRAFSLRTGSPVLDEWEVCANLENSVIYIVQG